MAGEFILKLLEEENARIDTGDRWLVMFDKCGKKTFAVYQRKPYQHTTRTLIETEDEEEACRILKGE